MKKTMELTNMALLYLIVTPIVITPFLLSLLSPHIHEDDVHGYVHPKYHSVLQAFKRNFGEGLEREGASVAIYHKGRNVVNLWGGYADRSADIPWKKDTRTVLFSATKAISSLCIALLVDRGYMSYNDKVVDFWPEYGKEGKENTTIEHVLSHMAGLPYIDDHIEKDDIIFFDRLMAKIENSKPRWMPGTRSGYHPVTFGFLIDGIIRKADEKNRDLATFFREEIAEKHDVDISIGVEPHRLSTMARVTQPSLWEYIRDCIKDPKMLGMLAIMYARIDEIVYKIRENPRWLTINFDTMAINDPSIAVLPMGAVTGISAAEPLARLFSKTLNGQLISNKTLSLLSQPTLNSWHLEEVTLWPVAKGRGFFFEKSPIVPGAFTFGHPGYGGQFIHVDPSQELVIAYLSNGLKTGSGELCGTYMRLFKETYNSLRYSSSISTSWLDVLSSPIFK